MYYVVQNTGVESLEKAQFTRVRHARTIARYFGRLSNRNYYNIKVLRIAQRGATLIEVINPSDMGT